MKQERKTTTCNLKARPVFINMPFLSLIGPSTPPQDVTAVSIGDSSIEVSWKAPANIKEHATGYSYVIYYTSTSTRTDVANWPTMPVGITMRYELQDLQEKTRYAIAVQLQTPHGSSEISGIVYSTTQPAAPRDFESEILINNEVILTWKPPRGHSRDLGYVVCKDFHIGCQ